MLPASFNTVISPENQTAIGSAWDSYVLGLINNTSKQVENRVETTPIIQTAPVTGKKELFLIGGAIVAVFLGWKLLKKGKKSK